MDEGLKKAMSDSLNSSLISMLFSKSWHQLLVKHLALALFPSVKKFRRFRLLRRERHENDKTFQKKIE